MEKLEIWKDIVWYEWHYQVSNLWRVKSLPRLRYWSINYKIKEKYIKLIDSNWYKLARLFINNKSTLYRVNRLVAQVFLWLDINDDRMFVCHKDDNPSNNRVDNLFLWRCKDNVRDCILKWRFKLPPLRTKFDNSFHKLIIKLTREWLSTRKISKMIWMWKSNVNVIQKKYFN